MSKKVSKESIDQQCMDDYREHEGKVLLVNFVQGMVDHNSADFTLEKPVRMFVIEHQRESDIINWHDGWCDPSWDVELLESHEELEQASSLWIDGTSRNINGMTGSGDWKLDPDQSKPAPKNPPQEDDSKIIEAYRKRARAFFTHELDENDWDIDDEPEVSVGKEGAYVKLWRWFPAED